MDTLAERSPTRSSSVPAPPPLGIEEEFVIVDPDTLLPLDAAAEVIERLSDAGEVPAGIVGEFLACQIEYATPVCADAAAAIPQLIAARRAIAATAADLGVGVASTGTPFFAADRPKINERGRYRRIGAEIGAMVDDHQLCGMHLHLGYDEPDQRLEALNRLGAWVPLFTALAANSPYWQGRDTGFASWRTVVLRRWHSIGVAGRFTDLTDYRRRRSDVLAAVGSDDPAIVAWTVRLSHHLPTIELRFGDAQLSVMDTVAICGFVRCVAAGLMTDSSADDSPHADTVNAAVWVAARDGHAAKLPNLAGPGVAPVSELVAEALDRFDASDELRRRMGELLARGSGADRQRRAFERGGIAALSECIRIV